MSNKEKLKCKGKDRNNDNCRNHSINDTLFCKYHDYMYEYTDEMLDNLKLCNGCDKMYYLVGKNKTCNDCINRGKANRLKQKQEIVLCKKPDCKFKKSESNDYCGKHQADYFVEQTELASKKVCYNYTRGCRTQLDLSYKYSKCETCLEKDRVKDKEKYHKNQNVKQELNKKKSDLEDFDVENILINKSTKNKNIIIEDDNSDDNSDDNLKDDFNIEEAIKLAEKINDSIEITNIEIDDKFKKLKIRKTSDGKELFRCSARGHWKPIENFIDDQGKIHKTCNKCRIKGRKADNSERRKAYKKAWKEKNYDKIVKYWMNYRGRKIEKDIDLFLLNNAKSAKAWRDKNPDKVKEINKRKRENVVAYLKVYKLSASTKNLKFELKDEEYFELVKQNCYYCEELQDKGFNGIDRKDSAKDYTKDNTVSCCTVCNFIKGCLTDDVFLKRVEHILTYQGYIDGKLYPKLFANHFTISFKNYERRAKEKNIKFELEEVVFYQLVIDDCYVCGKVYDDNHINGLDRLNSDLGYTIDNVETCCGECNFMKKKLNTKCFFEKLIKIKNHKLSHLKTINTKLRVNKIILKTSNVPEFIDSDDNLNENIDNQDNLDEYDLDFYNSGDDYMSENDSEKSVISNNNFNNNNKSNNYYKNNETKEFKNKSKKQKIIKTIEQIKEEARIRKRKQRERENKEIDVTINKHLNKKTPEQIREDARLRKQKQRERQKEKYQNKDNIEKRAKELKEKRDNK
jgi:hypothetical protein